MYVSISPARRSLILGTIMLATFMVAIESTIVATAMPRVVGELGGFSYYNWVFSSFLLAQSATAPIYGKLSDMFGRKPTLIVQRKSRGQGMLRTRLVSRWLRHGFR
jgi:MFS family permease